MGRPSSDYGIVFDNATSPASCPSNPDIAGIGVVLSFVLAALTTTIATIIAAVLDYILEDPAAFLPSQYFRWIRKGYSVRSLSPIRRWRRRLDRLILTFADQQLVTGFALLLAGYVSAFNTKDLQNAHWTLVVYLSCLSSSTHLAAVLTLRKYFDENKAAASLRVWLIVAFSMLVVAALSTSISFSVFFLPLRAILVQCFGRKHSEWNAAQLRTFRGLYYTTCILIFLYIYWIAVIQLLPSRKIALKEWLREKAWPDLRVWLGFQYVGYPLRRVLGSKIYKGFKKRLAALFFAIFLPGPMSIFILQIGFALIAAVFSLAQKFAKPTATDKSTPTRNGEGGHFICSLNTAADNKWDFGQMLPMILLLLPALSAWEIYNDKDD